MSFDSTDDNRAFAEKFGFNFQLLCDTERVLGLAYGACDDAKSGFAKRIGVVIDPAGRVREYEPAVNAGSYPADVLKRI